MKKILAVFSALSLTVTSAFAGNLSEPVITEVPDEPAASSAPWLPLVLLLGAVVLIASQDDNSSS